MSHNSLIFRYLANQFTVSPLAVPVIGAPVAHRQHHGHAALRLLGTGIAILLSASCAGMSQQSAGQTGGLVGAGVGAATLGAAAKSSGANRGQSMVAALAGGLGGYGVGTQIGRGLGLPGVDHTEVPNP